MLFAAPRNVVLAAWGLVCLVAVLSGCSRSPEGSRALIQNKGSDTLVNLAQAWAEAYAPIRPEVAVAVSGGGSGTGIAALVNGTVDIANASRSIKPPEREQITASQEGKKAVEHVVAADAVAFFVHTRNPLKGLTVEQLRCIYAEGGSCDNWPSVGVVVPGCSGQEIIRVSRQSNSGTYVFVREKVLGEQTDFKLGSRDMQGSKDVVELVSKTPCAIGYSGLAYETAGVRTLCVTAEKGADCIAPGVDSSRSGSYPLSRPLFMYTLGEPTGPVKSYLEWIRSSDGQAIVRAAGFIPVN